MEMIVIQKEELISMLSENTERMFNSLIENYHIIPKKLKQKNMGKQNEINEEIENWIPLHDAWKIMNIKKNMWYSKFQFIIQHKPYGKLVWVYKPSIYDFLMKDNINKKAN